MWLQRGQRAREWRLGRVVNSYTSLGGMNHGLASSCSAPDLLHVCVWEKLCETNDLVTQLNAEPATPGPTIWASIDGTTDTYAALKTQLELPCG